MIKTFISVSIIAFILTACSEKPSEYESELEKLQKNKMDFPNLKTYYFEGINYKLSDLFAHTIYNDFVIQENADVKAVNELEVYFTVEMFSEYEALDAQNQFNEDVQLLDAIHDMYLAKRIATLDQPTISIKKVVPERVKYPGYIQVISGSRYQNANSTSYFMATLEVEGTFYVFQLIGKKENMGYLHDDFIDIISSVSR